MDDEDNEDEFYCCYDCDYGYMEDDDDEEDEDMKDEDGDDIPVTLADVEAELVAYETPPKLEIEFKDAKEAFLALKIYVDVLSMIQETLYDVDNSMSLNSLSIETARKLIWQSFHYAEEQLANKTDGPTNSEFSFIANVSNQRKEKIETLEKEISLLRTAVIYYQTPALHIALDAQSEQQCKCNQKKNPSYPCKEEQQPKSACPCEDCQNPGI